MPFKPKKRRTESSPKRASDSDHQQQSRTKRAKIEKNDTTTTGSSKTTAAGGKKVDSNGDVYWELSKLRRVTVSAFRGKNMVNIREYYEKDNQELPGKKGISMTIDQYNNFIRLLPDIEAALSEKGETVPRPTYPGLDSELDRSNEAEAGKEVESGRAPRAKVKDSAASKRNIEATSDEEEEEEEWYLIGFPFCYWSRLVSLITSKPALARTASLSYVGVFGFSLLNENQKKKKLGV